MLTLIWEHGHAYQPLRIVDAIAPTTREVPGGVRITIAGKEKSARNWFELMVGPCGVYDLMISTSRTRSIDIEPLTLLHLGKLNPKCYREIERLMAEGETTIFPCAYAHPILPLLARNSPLDAEVNVQWALQSFHHNLAKPRDGWIFFWLSECAHSKTVAEILFKVAHRVLPSTCVVVLLDEFQGKDVDSSQPYRLSLAGGAVLVVFRSRWLSDAYAFSSDAQWVAQAIKEDIRRRRPRLLGAMVDAETYGGAYDPEKPVFFNSIREELMDNVIVDGSSVSVSFSPIDRGIKGVMIETCPEAELWDGSSWSDYSETHLVGVDTADSTGIVARRLGPLCRWTGLIPGNGRAPSETYFMVFEWIEPGSRRRYVRVLNSLWKAAFNAIRDRATGIVRETTLEILSLLTTAGRVEDVLLNYWKVVFGLETWEDFADKNCIRKGPNELEAAQQVLEGYRMACQESVMSDPTYWENFDTEVTWTSLALLAGGIIQAANACRRLGKVELLRKLAEMFFALFIDFGNHFGDLWREHSCPLDLFHELLLEWAMRRGYDMKQDLMERPATAEHAWAIAQKAYLEAFGKPDTPVWEFDVNPFIVLWKMYEYRGLQPEAELAREQATIYELEKGFRSSVSETSIPVRVGLFHARYFPEIGGYCLLPEDVETQTEMISSEAHAYDPKGQFLETVKH